MKRALALAGALAVAALGLSACDGSPPAVTVNGQVFTVSALNQQLAQLTGDKAFVSWFNQQAAANGSAAGGAGPTIGGSGGKDTYNQYFVHQILQLDIDALALQGYLKKHGMAPTQEQIQAARAAQETNSQETAYWQSLPKPISDLLVNFTADQGVLTPAPTDLTTLQQQYQALQPWLFSSVCVIEVSTTDVSSAYGIISAGEAAGAARISGANVCFAQTDLEAQPQAFQTAVLGLTKVGQIADPVKAAYGYEVLQLSSRTVPPLDAGIAQVLASAQGSPQLQSIISTLQVSVNANYGTWTQGCLVEPGYTVQEACGQQQ